MESRLPGTDLHSKGRCGNGLTFHVPWFDFRWGKGKGIWKRYVGEEQVDVIPCVLSPGRGSDAAWVSQFMVAPVGAGQSPTFWQPLLFCRWKWVHWQLHTENEKGFKTLSELLSDERYCWRRGWLISILQVCILLNALGPAPLNEPFTLGSLLKELLGLCFIASWQAV